jgi:hypothetical protein
MSACAHHHIGILGVDKNGRELFVSPVRWGSPSKYHSPLSASERGSLKNNPGCGDVIRPVASFPPPLPRTLPSRS